MDSISFFKGYGKVNPAEDRSSTNRKPARDPLITVAIAVIVLLMVAIGASIGALIHGSKTEPHESPALSTAPAESISTVCSVTRFPDSCVAAISNLDNKTADPELIFNLSLRVAANELSKVSSLPKTLISKSNDPRTESALSDCVDLFDEALSQLNRSATAMEVGPREKMLTEKKIGDLKTWISAAMTDLDTCLDGLEEMRSTVLDEARAKVQKSNEYMSNSLAILSNMQTILDKFHLTMHR